MQSEVEKAEASRAQRTYARLAGFLFLAVIALALAGGSILSHVAGSGTVRRESSENRSLGALISNGAFDDTDGEFRQRPACLFTVCNPQASQRFIGATRADLHSGRFIPRLDRADVRLRESTFLCVCTIGRRNAGCSESVRPDEQHCRGHGESRRYLLRHRLAHFLLPVFQIEVYPESAISVGLSCLSGLDRAVFCGSDLSATA